MPVKPWKVYHRIDPDFCESSGRAKLKNFRHVATIHVDTPDFNADVPGMLELVFEATNTVNTYWPKAGFDYPVIDKEAIFNPDIDTRRGYRSTSVGDMVQDPRGKYWTVSGTGWTRCTVK